MRRRRNPEPTIAERIADLAAYLKAGPDPLDYLELFGAYLEERGWSRDEIRRGEFHEDFRDPNFDDGQALEFLERHQEERDSFEAWLKGGGLDLVQNQMDLPASAHLQRAGVVQGDPWIAHFTSPERARAIKKMGFAHGEADMTRLAFTRYKRTTTLPTGPGWNFGFMVGRTLDAVVHANRGDYGTAVVLLRAPAVGFWHKHDGEYQVVFWGPSVRSAAVALKRTDGTWSIDGKSVGTWSDLQYWLGDHEHPEKRIGPRPDPAKRTNPAPTPTICAGRYFHGTSKEAYGGRILAEGIQPLSLTLVRQFKGRGKLTPVRDRVYVASELSYAIIYALGGVYFGATSSRFLREYVNAGKADRYGYLFVVPGSALKDVQPDEDQVGEALAIALETIHANSPLLMGDHGRLLRAVHNNELVRRSLTQLAEHLTPRQRRGVITGLVADQAAAGKKVLKHMSCDLQLWFIEHGSSIAHTGMITPSEAWRIDKLRAAELNADGSNFFDVAERLR